MLIEERHKFQIHHAKGEQWTGTELDGKFWASVSELAYLRSNGAVAHGITGMGQPGGWFDDLEAVYAAIDEYLENYLPLTQWLKKKINEARQRGEQANSRINKEYWLGTEHALTTTLGYVIQPHVGPDC